jgi:isocitrate dehydrogenase
MLLNLNPIVFVNGDQTAGVVAEKVREQIYGDVPVLELPCAIENRLNTKDGCVDGIVSNLKQLGSGVKISTATDDDRIEEAGLGSANIKMRKKMDVVGIFRHIEEPDGFTFPCAVFRYGSGGFYSEQSCEIVMVNGRRTAEIVTHLDLENTELFANLAMQLALSHDLYLHLSSKWTISASERLFVDEICAVFDAVGVRYEKDLTDVAMAKLATERTGGFLWLFDNPNGDYASDMVDWIDGTRSMTSTVYCADGTIYEEMPGGTAPDKYGTDLIGKNFFNPLGIIGCFNRAIVHVNPSFASRAAFIAKLAATYLISVDSKQFSTYGMIDWIALKLDDK